MTRDQEAMQAYLLKQGLTHMNDAIRTAVWDWEHLRDAQTPMEQANAMVALANSMSDLATWHPDWNLETGEIPDV